ncbi:MAG: RDD family protein, partial [Acidimicrobiales bacterium]
PEPIGAASAPPLGGGRWLTTVAPMERREPAAEHGPRAQDTDRLATVGQRVVGGLADLALAGTVLLTPGMLLRGAVTPDEVSSGVASIVAIVAFVFMAVYEIVPTALWGRTPGKAIVGTRVVGMGDGRVPGWKRAILRWVLPALAFQVHAVGWALALLLRALLVVDPLRRGVHDRLAGTIVVRG